MRQTLAFLFIFFVCVRPVFAGATPSPTPTPTPQAANLPPDVYVDIPDLKVVTSTVSGKTVQTIVEVPREFSQCSFVYGLSACIRFETLWPRAMRGFLRNPLLGSGYSTLTKSEKDEFTEAESTDNDFLRNAGETGILGLIGFYGPMVLLFVHAMRAFKRDINPLVLAFLFGMLAGTLGLWFNALYIDVFEASKVAFMYWAFVGIAFALIERQASKNGR